MRAWMFMALFLLLCLAGCYEPASTWDPHRGRFVSTEEYRRDEINREIDKRELQRDKRN